MTNYTVLVRFVLVSGDSDELELTVEASDKTELPTKIMETLLPMFDERFIKLKNGIYFTDKIMKYKVYKYNE